MSGRLRGPEALLVRALAAGLGALPWRAALALGARLGDGARALALRRAVAEANLAAAFPEREPAWRAEVLRAHYRELGRVAAEYAHLPALARAPRARVFAVFEGEEHLRAAAARGRGVIALGGHVGNFELAGAALAQLHAFDFVVRPLANPAVERWITRRRALAGVGRIRTGPGMRRAFAALAAGRWVAMLGDQDARRHGVFVPFLGRPASTPAGPARLSLASGAPIVFGACTRAPDGRHELRIHPPLVPEGDARDPEAVRALTARHVALLEDVVRARPEAWFWLHRRWKTPPPD